MFVSHDYTRLRAVRPRVLGAERKSVLKCRFWNTLSKPELSSSGVLGCTVLVRRQGSITFPTAARARLESSVFWVRTCRGEKLIIIKPGGQNSLRLHPHDVCVVLISSPRWREGVLYDAIVFETCDQWNASWLTELHRGKVKCIIGRFCFGFFSTLSRCVDFLSRFRQRWWRTTWERSDTGLRTAVTLRMKRITATNYKDSDPDDDVMADLLAKAPSMALSGLRRILAG